MTGFITLLAVALHLVAQAVFIGRAMLRPAREPAARMAWVVVILVAPFVGMGLYAFFGETNLGRGRIARLRAALARLPSYDETSTHEGEEEARISTRFAPLFVIGQSVSGFPPVGGNSAIVLRDNHATIDALVVDIDAARQHVHLMFYIWLADGSGRRIAKAAMRAARRGVTVRAMADDLGSRAMVRSPLWNEMKAAGVHLVAALPIGFAPLRLLKGRIDMRNHRKIAVIDNCITYCGSQNISDEEFAVKAKFAPWVDVMMRFTGPIARQNQHLFASDWTAHTREDLSALVAEPVGPVGEGFAAQAIGTSAAVRVTGMPEVFGALMYEARHELIVTTPYYVPDEPIQAALQACARRGVETTIVFPKRNDSRIVAAASRSYYPGLLDAGVRIFEFRKGLLHAKTLTVDGEVSLIGSANIDRRSFELNFENNILFEDRSLTGELRARQLGFIEKSDPVTSAQVDAWTLGERLRYNAVAMFGPVL